MAALMIRFALVCLVALLIVPAAQGRHRLRTICPTLYLTVHAGTTATRSEACRGNITPHVYVDNHLLAAGDQQGPNTVTFYGRQTVVSVHQVHNRVAEVTAVTLAPGSHRVRVWFTRTLSERRKPSRMIVPAIYWPDGLTVYGGG